MSTKTTILLTAVLSVVSGSASAPPPYGVPEVSPSSRTRYAYAYDVRDPLSGTYSSKKETRDGDIVYGNYAVEDPDGTRRVVYYSADDSRSSNAAIRRQTQGQDKVQSLPVIAVPVYVAPPPPPMHQVQLAAPVAIPLAPAILARAATEHEPPYYHTSLTSPAYSYSYR